MTMHVEMVDRNDGTLDVSIGDDFDSDNFDGIHPPISARAEVLELIREHGRAWPERAPKEWKS